MEQFYDNTVKLPLDQRNNKLNQIIGFLRQNQAHQEADAFLELKNCYPMNAFIREDMSFRAYLAWGKVFDLGGHRLIRHIVSQG